MQTTLGIVILAAGKGTRFKRAGAKVLADLLGRPLIQYLYDELAGLTKELGLKATVTLVTGHAREEVESYASERFNDPKLPYKCVFQSEQLGTGHALQTYFEQNDQAKQFDQTLVLCGDAPLVTQEDLKQLFEQFTEQNLSAVVASSLVEQPFGYGRIVPGEKGGLKIIEQKQLLKEQEGIREINSGVYWLKTSYLQEKLATLKPAKNVGEIYLTDIFDWDESIGTKVFDNASNFLGINDLNQLAEARAIVLKRKINELTAAGVMVLSPDQVYLDYEVEVAEGVTLFPGVTLLGGTKLGPNTTVENGCVIKNSVIGANNLIKAYCYLEDIDVADSCALGPFARLRPGTIVGEGSKIGNFVETKKTRLGPDVKISHLSYVGDAEVGEGTNIGCGFITCNYDGAEKHFTKIGKNAFIGSDTQVVAPLEIGDDAFIGSGSTITKDVPSGAFAIARTKQVTKEGQAKRFLKKK